MKHTNQHLLEKVIKKLKKLVNSKTEKPKLLSELISSHLQIFPEIRNYINENIKDNESKIFFELGKNLKYSKYQKGQFIKHPYDSDDFFYMIFSGDVAKIDIKYNRLYISFKDYLYHLIKLKLLGEDHIYTKCIRLNKNVFPFDEDMNVLTTDEIKIDHYQELIKSIKEKINHSLWLNNLNIVNNIEDFLNLYNPETNKTKSAFIGRLTKYPAYLPFYTFDKILDPISFIGQLTRPKGIKILSSYICLSTSDIFYIDKNEIDKNNNLYNLFQRRVSEDVIKKLFEGHFLFQDTDKSFLTKNYSKYFYVQRLVKGQKLIQQNTPFEGIYFINSGMFQLKTLRNYNELNDLQFSIIHSIDNFPKSIKDYQVKFNDIQKQNDKNENKKNIFKGLSQFQITKFTELRNISFNSYISPDVIGLNDIYDYKTGLNNFSVECISNEAEVYFLPNEIVTSLLTDESINSKVGEMVGKQCILHISRIRKYKEYFEQVVQFEANAYKENNKTYNNNIPYSLKLNNISNLKNSKLYNIKKRTKKNYSSEFMTISHNNTNFSSNKMSNTINNNNSINYFHTLNESKTNNSYNSSLKINNYQNHPNLLLLKFDVKNKNNKTLLNKDNSKEIKNYNNYQTYLKFYKPKNKWNNLIKKQLINSTEIQLTDRDNTNTKKNPTEENKNELTNNKSQIKIKTIEIDKHDKRKILFNKSYNKGLLKKLKFRKDSYQNFLKFNNFLNKNNKKKTPIKILMQSIDNKKFHPNKKLLLKINNSNKKDNSDN